MYYEQVADEPSVRLLRLEHDGVSSGVVIDGDAVGVAVNSWPFSTPVSSDHDVSEVIGSPSDHIASSIRW